MKKLKNLGILEKKIDSNLINAEERTQRFVKNMMSKYGSMEEFQKHYIYELVNNSYFSNPSDYFIQSIDLSSPNFMPDSNYIDFATAITGVEKNTKICITNLKDVDTFIELLPKESADILKLAYGLQGNKKHTLTDIADELKLNISKSRVGQKKIRAEELFKNAMVNTKIFLNDDIGNLLYFLQDFINIYGIRKRENITPEMQKEIMSMYKKQLSLKKEIDTRSSYVLECVTKEDKIQMLKNIFGDKINDDPIKNHFLIINHLSANEYFFLNNFIPETSQLNYLFKDVLPIVVMDKRNRNHVKRLKEKETIKIKFNKYFNHISKEYSNYIEENKDIYSLVTTPKSSLKKEMSDKADEYIICVQRILEKYNFHYEMSEDEIKMCIDNFEKKLKEVQNIEDLNVSENSIKVLSALEITTIEDFSNFGYNKLMQINSYVNESIDKSIFKNIPIKELYLSGTTSTALKRAGINNVDELRDMDEKKLRNIRDISKKSYNRIQEYIELFKNQNVDVVNLQNLDAETREALEAVVEALKIRKDVKAVSVALEYRKVLRNVVYDATLEVSKKYKSLFDKEIWQDEGKNEKEKSDNFDGEQIDFTNFYINSENTTSLFTNAEKMYANFSKDDDSLEESFEIDYSVTQNENNSKSLVQTAGESEEVKAMKEVDKIEDISAIEEFSETEELEDVDIDCITDKNKADKILMELVNNIRCSYSDIQNRIQEISEIGRKIDAQIAEIREAGKMSNSTNLKLNKLLEQKAENYASLKVAKIEKNDIEKIADDNNIEL